MSETGMRLRILLPFRVFAEHEGISRIVAETPRGYFGILPRRLDGVASLVPGILAFEVDEQGERFVAVDEGLLVKTGRDVTVSVRNAVEGDDLGRLREMVEKNFIGLDERERTVRAVMAKLETSFVRHLMEQRHE